MVDNSENQKSQRGRLLWLVLAVSGSVAGVAFGAAVLRLPFGPPLVMLGLGGMTLGLSALTLWRVLDPLLSPEPPRVQTPQEPARVRELQLEKQAVLKAIKEIEMDYQMRKLTEADWRELTQRYRVRALRIISELEAGNDFRALIEQELKHRVASSQAQSQYKTTAANAAAAAATDTKKSGA